MSRMHKNIYCSTESIRQIWSLNIIVSDYMLEALKLLAYTVNIQNFIFMKKQIEFITGSLVLHHNSWFEKILK
jgi:hypothetical protein